MKIKILTSILPFLSFYALASTCPNIIQGNNGFDCSSTQSEYLTQTIPLNCEMDKDSEYNVIPVASAGDSFNVEFAITNKTSSSFEVDLHNCSSKSGIRYTGDYDWTVIIKPKQINKICKPGYNIVSNSLVNYGSYTLSRGPGKYIQSLAPISEIINSGNQCSIKASGLNLAGLPASYTCIWDSTKPFNDSLNCS